MAFLSMVSMGLDPRSKQADLWCAVPVTSIDQP
uniref:Uncharacterized protein n=1 Tax=Ralstonia solanacearum TaxID=305 RepID=A0A0S4U1V4_RALSL|nr:protein of unknown function [Ralstonia solanacearum]